MMKCTSCGAEFPDGQRCCSDCGGKLEAPEGINCPECGSVIESDAAFCKFCGVKIVREQSKVCPGCGKTYGAEVNFCGACGADLREVTPTSRLVAVKNDKADVTPTDASAGKGKRAIGRAKSKTVAFETKHRVIVNAVIIALSIMFALFALLMPVNVVSYDLDLMVITDGFEDINKMSNYNIDDNETAKIKGHVLTVEQSLWKVFGALGYIGLNPEDEKDAKKINIIIDKFEDAYKEAYYDAFDEVKATNASTGSSYIPDSKRAKFYEELEEELEDKLSDINFLAYMLANHVAVIKDGKNGASTIESGDPGLYVSDVMTAVISTIVAVMSIIMAVGAIVALVLGILGILSKKQKLPLDKFLLVAIIASCVGLFLTAISPSGKAGGAMSAILLAASIAKIIQSIAVGVADSNVKLPTVIFRAVAATLMLIATLLFCTNIVMMKADASVVITVKDVTKKGSVIVYLAAPLGAFLAEPLSNLVPISEGVEPEVNMKGESIAGIIGYVLIAIIFLMFIVALCRALTASDKKKDGAKPGKNIAALAAAVAMLFMIIFIGAASPALCKAYIEPITKASLTIKMCASFYMRVQMYFAMFFALGAFVIAALLGAAKKPAAPAEPQPAAAPAQAE